MHQVHSLAGTNEQIFPNETFQYRRCRSVPFLDLAGQVGGQPLLRELTPRFEQWRKLVEHVSGHGFLGTMLTNDQQNRWGFITRDFEDAQLFRYTTFDRRGFIGHGTYNTADEACVALFDMGLRNIDDPNRLDDIATNCDWYTQ